MDFSQLLKFLPLLAKYGSLLNAESQDLPELEQMQAEGRALMAKYGPTINEAVTTLLPLVQKYWPTIYAAIQDTQAFLNKHEKLIEQEEQLTPQIQALIKDATNIAQS